MLLNLGRVAVIIVLFASPVLYLQETFDPARTVIHDCHIQASSVFIAAGKIAKQYKIIVGIDQQRPAGGNRDAAVDISIKNGTVGDLLNTLVAGNPQFSWEERPDGTIYIHTGNGDRVSPLSRVVISQFTLDEVYARKVVDVIERLPEVERWSRDNRCPQRRFVVILGDINNGKKISLNMSQAPLWQILDAVALQSGDYFWTVERYYQDGQCYSNIVF